MDARVASGPAGTRRAYLRELLIPLAVVVVASATYGFSAGLVHSVRLATWNLAKMPLLILSTCALCALAWFATAQFVTRALGLRAVAALSLSTFAELSMLLASLSPVCAYLALTIERPVSAAQLNEYPLFLWLNVLFIATSGSVVLVRGALRLARAHALSRRRASAVLLIWLALALFVGGQCAWYMRPFFGPAHIVDPPFMERTNPHVDGSTNFYEAVWRAVSPRVRGPR